MLHGCKICMMAWREREREASQLSLHSHFLPSAALDNSPHIYPFSLPGMKSEDNISLCVYMCVFVWEAFLYNYITYITYITSQISDVF